MEQPTNITIAAVIIYGRSITIVIAEGRCSQLIIIAASHVLIVVTVGLVIKQCSIIKWLIITAASNSSIQYVGTDGPEFANDEVTR